MLNTCEWRLTLLWDAFSILPCERGGGHVLSISNLKSPDSQAPDRLMVILKSAKEKGTVKGTEAVSKQQSGGCWELCSAENFGKHQTRRDVEYRPVLKLFAITFAQVQ